MAERDLRESIAILHEVGQEYGTALSQLALARFLVSQGRLEEARQALDQCVPVFERLEAALDLERASALHEAMAEPAVEREGRATAASSTAGTTPGRSPRRSS
jgi:hypothetical protein